MMAHSAMQNIEQIFKVPSDNIPGSFVTITNTEQGTKNSMTVAPNGSNPFSDISRMMCQNILFMDINSSRVRVWDLMILVPNALFLMFLLWRLGPSIRKLRASSSPMFTAFYGLIWAVVIISVLRCIVAMTVNASVESSGSIADKMLWLILRFCLLSTEASVITFGFYFGYLDSRTSIQRVLACTSFFALGYSAIQGTLELNYEHKAFINHAVNSTNYDLFAHGGMIFLCTSSAAFCLIYFIILILPLTRIKEIFILPSKLSFYYYVAVLAVLNFVQAMGSLLLYQDVGNALCVVDTTIYIYFTLFDPLVYITFLRKFFRSQRSGSLLFSYSHEQEEVNHHNSHLHHPHSLQLPHPTPQGLNQESSGDFSIAAFDRQPRLSMSLSAASSSPPTRLPTPFLSVNADWRHVSH